MCNKKLLLAGENHSIASSCFILKMVKFGSAAVENLTEKNSTTQNIFMSCTLLGLGQAKTGPKIEGP